VIGAGHNGLVAASYLARACYDRGIESPRKVPRGHSSAMNIHATFAAPPGRSSPASGGGAVS